MEASLGFLNGLLVPGGFLIVLEADGNPQTPGGKWIDHVFSPRGRWPGLRGGKRYHRKSLLDWDTLLTRTNFHIMNGDKNDPNSLFLVLCAQKPSLPLISSSSADAPNTEQPIIFSFELARALDLQQIILDVMSSSGRSATIWIEATSGTLDGGVATGFARSLMRELVAIEIRLVLFDPVWTAESRIGAIRELSRLTSLESEIALDGSGVVLVPRLRSYAPRIPDTLDSGKYWTMTQPGTVVQSAPPSPGPDQVLVKISSLSHEEGGLQALVGTVARSRSSEWQVGARIVAVVPSTRSNFVLVHEGQLSNIPEMVDDHRAINLALALVFVALGLRLDSRPLKSLKQIQVVVLHTGEFASSITRVLEHLGVKPVLIAPRLPLVLPRLSPGDIVLCGLPAESARTMPRVNGVFIFNWNDADHGALAAVRQNPWLVSTTIDVHLAPAVSAIGDMNCDSLTPEQLLPQIFEVSQSLSLADDKFYLIIGGIGALGLQMAIWMYRVSNFFADTPAIPEYHLTAAWCTSYRPDIPKGRCSTCWPPEPSYTRRCRLSSKLPGPRSSLGGMRRDLGRRPPPANRHAGLPPCRMHPLGGSLG